MSGYLCAFLELSGLGCAELGFDFSDPLAEAALDFRYSLTLAKVSSLVKMLEVSAQFLQEFVGESLSHRKLILHLERCGGKITRNWIPKTYSPRCGQSSLRGLWRRRDGGVGSLVCYPRAGGHYRSGCWVVS